MPGCSYFVGNTFAHLFGGLALTAISTENAAIKDMSKKPFSYIAMALATFLVLLVTLVLDAGFTKYAMFGAFCILVGQLLSGFVGKLQTEKTLFSTLIILGSIFVTMMFLGFSDKGNMLPYGTYLTAGLIGLIVSMILTAIFVRDEKEAETVHLWLSRVVVILFTLFLAYDVQVLKEHAKACKSNPDYVQESLGLYLDIINLFQGVGDLNK